MTSGEIYQGRLIAPSPNGARTNGAARNVSTFGQLIAEVGNARTVQKATIAENVIIAKSGQDDPGHGLKDKYSTVVNYALIVRACYPSD